MMRRLLFSTAMVFSARTVWAAEAVHGTDSRLPQVRPEYFSGQIFWLALSFALLYMLLHRVALPRIAATQAARQKRRDDDLSAAAMAHEKAKHLLAANEASLLQARRAAQDKLAAIAKAAQDHAAEQQQAQQRQLQAKLSAAETQIAADRAKALAQVRDAAVGVAQSMVQHLTGLNADPAAAIDRLHKNAA